MIVIACSIDSDDVTDIARYTTLANINVPQWVYDKIAVLKGVGVIWKKADMVDEDWHSVDNEMLLQKNSGLSVTFNQAVTITADTEFRVQFDLLID